MPDQTIIAQLKANLRDKFPAAHKQTTSDPTPDDIRKTCIEIQSEWTDVEHHKRQCKEVLDYGQRPFQHQVTECQE